MPSAASSLGSRPSVPRGTAGSRLPAPARTSRPASRPRSEFHVERTKRDRSTVASVGCRRGRLGRSRRVAGGRDVDVLPASDRSASLPSSPSTRAPLPRVIAVANQKGGVGKTTTAVNLGACLADLGYRTLVVDLDPQGNATTGLGIDTRNLETSMYDVVLHDASLDDCVEPTAVKNLFVAPASLDLAGAEIELVAGLQPRAAAAAGPRGGARRLRLRAHRLPPIARPADRQRPGGRQRGAGADPVRVLRPRGPRAAAAQRRPGAARPQPHARGQHDHPRDVRRPDEAGRPGRPARCGTTSATRSAARSCPGRSACPRHRRFGQPIIAFDPTSRGAIAYRELAKEVSGGAPQRAR